VVEGRACLMWVSFDVCAAVAGAEKG
jgi:hypothetical protein